jgi:glycosyltransferase involved in cell wall biosynthesis
MNNNLISIIIPCYNQGEFLNETILSVYNQTNSNWECIIINDGSTDNSDEIANEWVRKDNRFKYFYKENEGVSSARNLGLEKVNGNYIQFLDSDDLLDSRKLELSLLYLSKSQKESEKLVISNFGMLSIDSKKIIEPYCKLNEQVFDFENLLYKWNESFSIPIHCGFFETSLFENIRFPENLSAQEDWIVWVKIFKLDVQAIFLVESLALYRQNSESRTMTKSIFNDQMLAYEHFKIILTESEFYSLSKVLISRYYREQEVFKNRLNGVKNSKTYQTGLMIKKISKALRLLNFFKKLFPILLKLKSK